MAQNNLLVGAARAEPIWKSVKNCNLVVFYNVYGSHVCPTAVRSVFKSEVRAIAETAYCKK